MPSLLTDEMLLAYAWVVTAFSSTLTALAKHIRDSLADPDKYLSILAVPAASTLADAHGHVFSKLQLEIASNQTMENKWVFDNHDTSRHPIGKILDARLMVDDEGIDTLVYVVGFFDFSKPESYRQFAEIIVPGTSSEPLPPRFFDEEIAVTFNYSDREIDPEVVNQIKATAPRQIHFNGDDFRKSLAAGAAVVAVGVAIAALVNAPGGAVGKWFADEAMPKLVGVKLVFREIRENCEVSYHVHNTGRAGRAALRQLNQGIEAADKILAASPSFKKLTLQFFTGEGRWTPVYGLTENEIVCDEPTLIVLEELAGKGLSLGGTGKLSKVKD